jgi:hypothetical protein|tara:strand:+ start:1053 stop:2090 length:1038 start_codon:yes stop_codon:yes gene_type:complete
MALSDTSKINIALKKVLGKAQTSNSKEVSNEGIGSNISIAASTIFGDTVPTPVSSSYYTILSASVEKLRLIATPIDGTKDDDGLYQAFELKLPADYQANSSNSKKGTASFINSQILNTTNGALQVVPSSFGAAYTATVYHTSSTETQIPALDDRDWVLDYYNGILFQQDPPADTDENPVFVDAFLYIGDYVQTKLSSSAAMVGGIFTEINGTKAYTTSSIQVGSAATPTQTLAVAGSSFLSGAIVYKHTASVGVANTTYTAAATDYYISVDCSATAVDVKLPLASALSDGQTYVVKDQSGDSETYNIKITASGADLIDGQSSVVLQSPYAAIQLFCNGTDKYFIF